MNLHVIIGEDEFLVSQAAAKIVGDGTGLEVIDSMNSTNAELQLKDLQLVDASFSTPPFLDPRKVTWWKNVGFLPAAGGKKGPSEEVKEALERFAAKLVKEPLPENQHFILSGPHLMKGSVFAKTLATGAEILSFAAGKPWEMARAAAARMNDLAAAAGLRFDPKALDLFISRVGTDSRSLMSEFEKLRAYLGKGATTIGTADVNEITSQGAGVEPEVWAITDAIGARDLEKALLATERFSGESGFSVYVTSVVEKFFRQLVELKTAEVAGRLKEATAGMNPYAVKKNVGFLANWRPNELRRARARFLQLREKAVSGAPSADVLVMCELVRACRPAERRKA